MLQKQQCKVECQLKVKTVVFCVHSIHIFTIKAIKALTSIDVLPSKIQALYDYCTLANKLKHY